MSEVNKQVVIAGAGFGGLNCAKRLARDRRVSITLIDKRNFHLFQPLLYQVAMAGLSPADIAAPIRSLMAHRRNVRVICAEATRVDLAHQRLTTSGGELSYDYLVLACGARHSYFGHPEWEPYAPGLKTIEQATEIRRRVLSAFELAEITADVEARRKLLTFVVVGGGPTGVELAGAIGEMSRFTLARDFRTINPSLARIILVEAAPRILGMFPEILAARATRDLEKLGVQVWTESRVTQIDERGVVVGQDRISAATVLWAAGVQASAIGRVSDLPCDAIGRIQIGPDLSVPHHANVFAIGDLAACPDDNGKLIPGLAPVAVQQGRHVASQILRDLDGGPRRAFKYLDKGQMATIGRSRAIAQVGYRNVVGFPAWLMWLFVHIWYLTGFRNRVFVFLSWAWSFVTFKRGARLIVWKDWRGEDERL